MGSYTLRSRDRAVDEIGVDRPQGLLAQAESIGRSRPPVLDKDVGFGDQSSSDFEALFLGQVHRNSPLVAIAIGVEGGQATPGKRGKSKRIAHLDGFELDDVRSLIGKHHRRQGARYDGRSVDYLDSVERSTQAPPPSRCVPLGACAFTAGSDYSRRVS